MLSNVHQHQGGVEAHVFESPLTGNNRGTVGTWAYTYGPVGFRLGTASERRTDVLCKLAVLLLSCCNVKPRQYHTADLKHKALPDSKISPVLGASNGTWYGEGGSVI